MTPNSNQGQLWLSQVMFCWVTFDCGKGGKIAFGSAGLCQVRLD